MVVYHTYYYDLFVYSRNRCSIFVSSQSLNNGETVKLRREERTVIFDLATYFMPAFLKYIHQQGPKPSTEVIVSFGQRFDLQKESQNDLLISATITHPEASNLVTRVSLWFLVFALRVEPDM